MKNCILIFLAVFSQMIFAQDTISYSKLTVQQFKAWEEIEKNWRTEKFMPLLKQHAVKMNCASCTSVYAWVVFKCDSAKTSYVILNNKKCGTEMKGKFLIDFKKIINAIILPAEFINTYFKVHLGNGLKC